MDVAESRRADGERRRERHDLVALPGQRAEPDRHVDVGRGEHARRVELPQQPGRPQRAALVEEVRLAHAATAPSSTSLSSSTSAGDGRQANTPPGVPAPPMPRRNR